MRLLIEGDFTDLADMVVALQDHRVVTVTLLEDEPKPKKIVPEVLTDAELKEIQDEDARWSAIDTMDSI